MTVDEMLRHAGELMPGEIKQKARRIMRHYVWWWKKGRSKYGLCTACGREIEHLERRNIELPQVQTPKGYEQNYDSRWEYQMLIRGNHDWTARHLSTGACPVCGTPVQFRSLAMGRNTKEDKYFLIIYRKSAVDPKHIVCIGYRIEIDWWRLRVPGDGELPIFIEPAEVCLFRWGQPSVRMIYQKRWCYEGGWDADWEIRKKCESGYVGWNDYMGKRKEVLIFRDDALFRAAMEGTPWGKIVPYLATSDAFGYIDKITLMARAGRYPCIEYLVNMGKDVLAANAVDGRTKWTGRYVGEGQHGNVVMNLRGKTPTSVLRLTKDEWAEIKGRKIRLDWRTLWVIQSRRHYGVRMGIPICQQIAEKSWEYEWQALNERPHGVDPVKAVKYCMKKSVILREYIDHLEQCERIGADMRDEQVVFPKYFHEMHQRVIEQANILREEERQQRQIDMAMAAAKDRDSKNEKIGKLVKKLGAYRFEAVGLVMELFASAEEIIMEGARQSICIGSYVGRYADGGTILCKLRRVDEPDKPFHAVEFTKDGRMVQCRGVRNETLDTDEEVIRAFWAAWDKAKGTKTYVGLRIRKTKQEARIA